MQKHGLPNAIALEGGEPQVQLAYTAEHSSYAMRAPGVLAPARALSEGEIDLLDPDRRLDHQAEVLRDLIAQSSRLQRVAREVVRVLPSAPGVSAGASYGFLSVEASPASARLYSVAADAPVDIVVWVNPRGPAADVLQVGDQIQQINGVDVTVVHQTCPIVSEGPRHFRIARFGQVQNVTVTPEAWPRRVLVSVVPDEVPNAFAVREGIGVTTGFLALFPNDDDAVASVVGHELAHIALGHTDPGLSAAKILQDMLTVGLVLPANAALPGSGDLLDHTLGTALRGVSNRFNRDQERDADRVGLHYARAAGYDPHAALGMMDVLQKRAPVGGVSQFVDIHPPYPERRELVESELRQIDASASAP